MPIPLEDAAHRGNMLGMRLLLNQNDKVVLTDYSASDYFDSYASQNGVELLEYEFNTNILGNTCSDEYGTTIAVNKNLNDTRRNFTLAHEIAHLELHVNTKASAFFSADLRESACNMSGIEKEANAFAAGFLMPKSTLISHLHRGHTSHNMAQSYKVSRQSLYYRMIDYLRMSYNATYSYADEVTNAYFLCLTKSECLSSEYLEIINEKGVDFSAEFI